MEYEQVKTLATVRGIRYATWDALGEQLVIELEAGPLGREPKLFPVPVTIPVDVVRELHTVLGKLLEEREAGPLQPQ